MMELSAFQLLIILLDTFLEAIWPVTLMITIDDGEYPYDAYVMQSLAIFVAFFISLCIDFIRQNYVFPSFNVGWDRLLNKVLSSTFLTTAVYLMLLGFKTASSGAAATCGFFALPMFVFTEITHAVLWWDTEELESIRKKISGVTAEILLIISTCATLFILEDKGSKPAGVFLISLGRFFIVVKSYINGRSGEVPVMIGTISNATLFLAVNSVMMYVFSQPAAELLGEGGDVRNLIPHHWSWWTLLPFFTLAGIYVSNILVETVVTGEMQAITGMSGRILGMYISFTYDVIPTSGIVLSCLCITWAVVAYMRMHYHIAGTSKDPKLTSIDLHDGHKSLLQQIRWTTY